MRKDKKVVFMGTPEFASKSLEALVESGYNVVACFTNADKPSGRGLKLKASPVKECAIRYNIPVYQPKKIRKNDEILEILKSFDADFFVVVAYGKILPQEVLDIPKLGSINVHASLLPKYRGAAPMQWALINGEEKTGVTTMFMDAGIDTGDMLLKEEIQITDEDNLETIHDKLMIIGSKLLINTLDGIVDGTVKRMKQGDDFCLSPMIHREMTKIDFNKTSREIFNFVRGLSPFPGTYMESDEGKKYKVFNVKMLTNEEIGKLKIDNFENAKNGEVVYVSKDSLCIKCKDFAVSILQIQPQNSKRMDIRSFLAGNKIQIGDKF